MKTIRNDNTDRHKVDIGVPDMNGKLDVIDEATAVDTATLRRRLDHAEETAGQLYKIADAAQAAIDLLRLKLAEAEVEIGRLRRDRTIIAAELYRQTNLSEASENFRTALRLKLAEAEAEIDRLRADHTVIATELHRENGLREAAENSEKEISRKCDVLATELLRTAHDRDRLVPDRMASERRPWREAMDAMRFLRFVGKT